MSQKTYRLGVIGFAHMHVNTLIDHFAALPNVEWVACADTRPAVPTLSTEPSTRTANIKRALERTGIPRQYDDYQEMLEKESFDIIIFCPENARHAEVCEAIAAKGIHMITEKPMASSLSDALQMVRAAKAANVRLMVNWPITWSSAARKAKELVEAGVIGELWEVKWRNGASLGPLAYGQDITDTEKGAEWWHQAAQGGGALLDYCCYGALVSSWYLDQPAQGAFGLKANLRSLYGDADDNAVIAVRFAKGMAILEGSWTTYHIGVPTGPILYGSHGTIVVGHPTKAAVAVFKDRKTQSHEKLLADVNRRVPQGFEEPTAIYEGDPFPGGRDTLAKEFLHHLETGEPLHPTLDLPLNLEAMAILDAGIRSSESGQFATVNSAHWCIG